jgi:hypothetical protein
MHLSEEVIDSSKHNQRSIFGEVVFLRPIRMVQPQRLLNQLIEFVELLLRQLGLRSVEFARPDLKHLVDFSIDEIGYCVD